MVFGNKVFINMELREHQLEAVANTPNKWGLFFQVRVGKTPTAITLANTRARSCLVICPKSLRSQWRSEINVWAPNSECEFLVLSKEEFRKQADNLKCYESIVVDEAHYGFGNYKSLLFRQLSKYITQHNTEFIWLLTGTPYTATPWSAYSYALLLGKISSQHWLRFCNKFFTKIKMGRKSFWKPKSNIDGELQDFMRSFGTFISLKDVADVADDYDEIETFALNAEQKRTIKEQFDPMPVIRYGRQHQIENGVIVESKQHIDCDKSKRVLELVSSLKKAVIICRYKEQQRLLADLIVGIGREVFIINGDIKEEAGQIAQKAEAVDDCVVLIQADTVAGYSLKSFNTMIFASMSYSFVNYEQAKGRIRSIDKLDASNYIHLLTDGDSIDRAVYDCVLRKQNFSEELYEKR